MPTVDLTVTPDRFIGCGPAVEWMDWCEGRGKPPKDELLWEGPAGTGKTRAAWEGLIQLADRHPDLRVAVVRRTRVSMTQSVLALLENQVLGPQHPVIAKRGGREHWTGVRWPNGAEFAFIGLDDPIRLYSTEWHVIWVNEAQEVDLRQWETLHRGLRAPGGPGWRLLMGDYNPPHEAHWICTRGEPNRRLGTPPAALHRMWRHDFNPTLFDHRTRTWTEKGVEYLGKLRRTLSGPRLLSLLYGKRASAAGIIWPTYDPYKHRIDASVRREDNQYWLDVPAWAETGAFGGSPVRLEWFLAALDFGYRAPGCMQVWGFDKANRAFRVAEIYRTEKDIDWWAEWATKMHEQFRYTVGVADHNPSEISVLNRRVGPLVRERGAPVWRPWDKTKSADAERAGINQMRVRWKQDAAFLVNDAFPAGLDQRLLEEYQPTCLEEEIPQYVYPEQEPGKVLSDTRREAPDPASADHACDAARGMAAYAFLRDLTPRVAEPTIDEQMVAKPGDLGYAFERRHREDVARLGKPERKGGKW